MLGIKSQIQDISDIAARPRISFREKLKLVIGNIALKFQRGVRELGFLGYRVAFGSRTNCIGIIREVFIRNDYDFRPATPAPHILDVGANIGIATLYFAHHFPEATIQSFEAMPENYNHLLQNVEGNKLKNVTTHLGFLGRTTGTRDVFFNEKSPGGSTGIDTVVASKNPGMYKKVSVPSLRLSDFVVKEVDFMKMDVEGAEGDILRDLDETGTMTRIKEMVFEYHYNLANDTNSLADVLALLKKNGFSVVIYDNEDGSYGKAMRPIPIYHFMIRAFRAS